MIKNIFSQRSGYFYAVIAAVLFGASTPAAKWLLSNISPWLLAGILYLGSGVGLYIIHLIRKVFKKEKAEAAIKGKDWYWLFGATLFGGILAPAFLLVGLAKTDAGSASLLLNLESVATALLAWFVFKENFDKRIMLGMLAILAGSLVLSWTDGPNFSNSSGTLLIAAACLSWGIDNNLTKKISASDALQIAMIKGLVAGLTNTLLALNFDTFELTFGTSVMAALVGFFGYGVSLFCFVLALRHIGAARTGAYFSLAPFIGAFLAVIFGAQEVNLQLTVASILMGFGVWLHLTERHEHEHIHEEIEHEHSHVHEIHHQHTHLAFDPKGEPHTHRHRHERLVHTHPHFPDTHHNHIHD